MMSGNKRTSSNVFHLERPADRLRLMLTFYLKTTEDAAGAATFSLPRSEEVDRLLLQIPLGRDITEELSLVLTRHRARPGRQDPNGPGARWARETARRLHPVSGLSRRLRGYIDALAELDRELEQDEVVVVSMLAEPPSEPALLARRPTGPVMTDALEQQLDFAEERHYFRRRLAEELSRCSRGNAPLSMLLIQAREAAGPATSAVEQSVRRSLREYDILCHTAAGEFRVVLPGAGVAGCRRIVPRLRATVAAGVEGKATPRVAFGAATWPDQAAGGDDLLEQASIALIEDRHRPPTAAHPAAAAAEPATVSFEGFAQQVRVDAVPTPSGLRLRLPLRFLRRGSAIQLGSSEEEGTSTGVLTAAVLGRGTTATPVPMLYVDVTPTS